MVWSDGYGLIEGEPGEIINELTELEWLMEIIRELKDEPLG